MLWALHSWRAWCLWEWGGQWGTVVSSHYVREKKIPTLVLHTQIMWVFTRQQAVRNREDHICKRRQLCRNILLLCSPPHQCYFLVWTLCFELLLGKFEMLCWWVVSAAGTATACLCRDSDSSDVCTWPWRSQPSVWSHWLCLQDTWEIRIIALARLWPVPLNHLQSFFEFLLHVNVLARLWLDNACACAPRPLR